MDLAGCGEIGRSQDGLITRDQSLKFLSKKQIQGLLEKCVWQQVNRFVYLGSLAPITWLKRVRAAVLACGEPAVISGMSAAYMWGLLEREPRTVDVMVPFGRSSRLPGVDVHRTRSWHVEMLDELDGMPISTPARAIIDISRFVSKYTLLHAVDLAITAKQLTLDDIASELERIGSQGLSRCSLLFGVLAERDSTFEATDHVSEAEALAIFKAAGLLAPVPQARIPLDAITTAYPDFVYFDKKIWIEIISWRWHGGPSKFEDDVQRKVKARAQGWLILEISRKTFLQNPASAIAAVKSAIAERS